MDKRIAKLIPKDKFKLGMTIKNGKLKTVKVKGGIMLIETDLTIGEVDLDGLG
ncbi:MAG: hypothetical protein HUJ61_04950 [Bacilli bacterium]|nr:hypothetical protein [Bacilli bacterium]